MSDQAAAKALGVLRRWIAEEVRAATDKPIVQPPTAGGDASPWLASTGGNSVPDIVAKVGEIIKYERESSRLSQRQLTKLSGVSHTTIARLERSGVGSRGELVAPTLDTLRALARGCATDSGGVVDQGRFSHIYIRLVEIAASVELPRRDDPLTK